MNKKAKVIVFYMAAVKKTYLVDEDGNPLCAAWYDAWIAPDGKVVRKSEPRKELSVE